MGTPTAASQPPPLPDFSLKAAPPQVAGPRWSRRWRRWRPGVIAMALMLIPVLVTVWTRTIISTTPLAINSPKDWGTVALAGLLRDEGIFVSKAGSLFRAVNAGREGATIVVVNADRLSSQDRRALAESDGDVVIVGAESGSGTLVGLTGITAKGTATTASSTRAPQYDDADVQAARSLAGTHASVSLQGDGDAAGCFPVGEDRHAYATDSLPSGATLRVLPDPALVTNVHLAQEGHVALGVRALGHHSRVLWLDGEHMETPSAWNSPPTPPWLPVLILQLLVIAGALAIVQGRRFGGIVSEDLPIVVCSIKTTVARGCLYRQGPDRPRAAQALRSGTALRLGATLGLPPGTSRRDVIAAVSLTSGIAPAMVDSLLYGPPLASDNVLATLAVQLDQLESEVHPI